jgi:DNA-binding winged helix-turn-helix (wHTH) protein
MAAQTSEPDKSSGTVGHAYAFGRFLFQIEDNAQTLFSEGHVVALSTAESTILRVLLEQNGDFVKTEDLLKYISPSPMASENLVHGAVRGLRRTLNDADLIRNERSRGYSFTGGFDRRPIVTEAGSTTAAALSQSPPGVVEPAAKARPRTQRDPFVAVALLVTAPVVMLPFGLILFGGNWESLPRQLGFIEALMILVGLAYDFYFLDSRRDAEINREVRRAALAVRQLRRFWRLLLVSWCCLYLTLPFSQWFAPVTSTQAAAWQWQATQVIATFLNNASALMLVLCYVVLNRPTVIKVVDKDVEGISLRPGLLIIVGLGLLEAVLVAMAGRLGVSAEDVLFAFDLLSGIIGGIAMALCISRLDSRLLGTKGLLPIIPVVLYFYVVIQPFYPLINRTFPNRAGLSEHFDLWIIQLAFMFKAVMYIYVSELFRTERFLFYMIHARRIYENVESEWTNFKTG